MSSNTPDNPYLDRFDKVDLTLAKILNFVTPGGTAAPAPTPGQGPGTQFDTAPVPPAPQVAGWWRPTPAQYTAFAARLAFPVSSIQPVPDDQPAAGFPTLPPVTVEADQLEYAGYGYGPDGKQHLFHVGKFTAARAACDAIFNATTPDQANAAVAGAEAANRALLAIDAALVKILNLIGQPAAMPGPTPGTVTTPAPVPGAFNPTFYDPTPVQQAAFAARFGLKAEDLTGDSLMTGLVTFPTFGPPTWPGYATTAGYATTDAVIAALTAIPTPSVSPAAGTSGVSGR